MVKEEGSRAEELRALGWSAEEVRTYEELWEYRQRWGAINLEPEERQLLRKAEALQQASELCRHNFNGAFLEILVDRLSMANTRLSQLLADKNISVF